MFYDAIVLLGLYMPGGEAAPELIARVEKAAACWIEGRAPTVIPCGGQRADEPWPEAAGRAELLRQQGLPVTAIRPETESLPPEQNLINAKRMLESWGGKTALIVTSDVHMRRALAVCRDIGLSARGVPVRTPGGPSRWKACVLECLGWAEYKLGWQHDSRRRAPRGPA
jgi:uncharacterized SAM-binding protein YcdF (DUF218 family)